MNASLSTSGTSSANNTGSPGQSGQGGSGGENHGVAEEEADSSVTEETEVIPQQAAIPFPMEEREGRKSRIIPPSEALAGAVGLPIQEAEAVAIPVEPVAPMANPTPQEVAAVHTTPVPTRRTPRGPMTDTDV